MFRDLGQALGYTPKLTFSAALPTDGVWLAEPVAGTAVPVVAIEVLVSESRKTIRGSVLTLELVSPALGIVLVHEEELRRRHIRSGGSAFEADRRVQLVRQQAEQLAGAARQRLEVWSFQQLRRVHARATTVGKISAARRFARAA
jgi:hypothetical protein